jgi:hypothetical protein
VGLEVATETGLDLEAVGPDVQERVHLDAVGRLLQVVGLVTHGDGEVSDEGKVAVALAWRRKIDDVAGSGGIVDVEVVDNLGEVHANLLTLHVDWAELMADLAAHEGQSPEGTVALALDVGVLELHLGGGELLIELLADDVGGESPSTIETGTLAESGKAGAAHKESLLGLAKRMLIDLVAQFTWKIHEAEGLVARRGLVSQCVLDSHHSRIVEGLLLLLLLDAGESLRVLLADGPARRGSNLRVAAEGKSLDVGDGSAWRRRDHGMLGSQDQVAVAVVHDARRRRGCGRRA